MKQINYSHKNITSTLNHNSTRTELPSLLHQSDW